MKKITLSIFISLFIFNLSCMESANPALSLESLPRDMQTEWLKHAIRPLIHQAIIKTKKYEDFKRVTTGATVAYIPCTRVNNYFKKFIQEKVAPAILAEQETKNIIDDHYYTIFMNYLQETGLKIESYKNTRDGKNYCTTSFDIPYNGHNCWCQASKSFDFELGSKSNKEIFIDPAFNFDTIGEFLIYTHINNKDKLSLRFLTFLYEKHISDSDKGWHRRRFSSYYYYMEECTELKQLLGITHHGMSK